VPTTVKTIKTPQQENENDNQQQQSTHLVDKLGVIFQGAFKSTFRHHAPQKPMRLVKHEQFKAAAIGGQPEGIQVTTHFLGAWEETTKKQST
jgi:hypothetical protein